MKTKISFFIILIALIFTSCNNDDDTTVDSYPIAKGLRGNLQKGPFITGSNVLIQLLDENLQPTGIIYSTTTNNDFGGFNIENQIQAPYIEVITDGFYFDEVKGVISDAKITLRSLSKVDESGENNINILTTLSKERIVYLIRNEGLSYETAKAKAQNEILSIFNIINDKTVDFNKMNISQDGDENGILLAISSILQGNLRVGDLSELMAKLIKDIEKDGVLDDENIKSTLLNNASDLDLASIRSNLERRYRAINYDATIPSFEKYAKRLTPLSITKRHPEANVYFEPSQDEIKLYFNKALDDSTISSNNITVVNASGKSLSGTLTYSQDDFTIRFKPTEEMLHGEEYTVKITNLIALDKEEFEGYSFKFNTFSLELEKGLKGYYPLTNNADDATGNGFHAKAYNGDYVSDINNGTVNKAYHLQGRGSYVEIPRPIDLNSPNWSYSIWVNYKSLDKEVHSLLLGFYNSTSEWAFEGGVPLSIQNTNRPTGGEDYRQIVIIGKDERIYTPVRGNLVDTWNLFTVTVENSHCRVYQNGVLVGEMSSPLSFYQNSGLYYISQAPNMFDINTKLVYLDALINNVRFYDRALNRSEVYELYKSKL